MLRYAAGSDITQEPDYEAVLDAVKKLLRSARQHRSPTGVPGTGPRPQQNGHGQCGSGQGAKELEYRGGHQARSGCLSCESQASSRKCHDGTIGPPADAGRRCLLPHPYLSSGQYRIGKSSRGLMVSRLLEERAAGPPSVVVPASSIVRRSGGPSRAVRSLWRPRWSFTFTLDAVSPVMVDLRHAAFLQVEQAQDRGILGRQCGGARSAARGARPGWSGFSIGSAEVSASSSRDPVRFLDRASVAVRWAMLNSQVEENRPRPSKVCSLSKALMKESWADSSASVGCAAPAWSRYTPGAGTDPPAGAPLPDPVQASGYQVRVVHHRDRGTLGAPIGYMKVGIVQHQGRTFRPITIMDMDRRPMSNTLAHDTCNEVIVPVGCFSFTSQSRPGIANAWP